MHFLRITDDTDPDEIAEAALWLMRREASEGDDIIRGFISEDVDELINLHRRNSCDGVPA